MRQIICDDKGCRLEPSHQNLVGGGGVSTLNQSSGGLAPVAPSKLIPLVRVKRENLTGGQKPKALERKTEVKKPKPTQGKKTNGYTIRFRCI